MTQRRESSHSHKRVSRSCTVLSQFTCKLLTSAIIFAQSIVTKLWPKLKYLLCNFVIPEAASHGGMHDIYHKVDLFDALLEFVVAENDQLK